MKKEKRINLRVSEEDFNLIKLSAENAGETVSSFLVKQALRRKVLMAEAPLFADEKAKEIIKYLGNMANNINQVAHLANTRGNAEGVDFSDVQKVLLKLMKTIASKSGRTKKEPVKEEVKAENGGGEGANEQKRQSGN